MKRHLHSPILLTICSLLVLSLSPLATAKDPAENDKIKKNRSECEEALEAQPGKAKDTDIVQLQDQKNAVKNLHEHLLETHFLPTSKAAIARAMGLSIGEFTKLFAGEKDAAKILRDHLPHFERIGKEFVGEYMRCAAQMGATPRLEEFAQFLGISAEQLSSVIRKDGVFESIQDIKQLARKMRKSFRGILDRDIFNAEHEKALIEAVRTKQRLIITTAVAGATVEKNFLRTLQSYAKKNDAAIIVIPLNMETEGLDAALLDTPNVHILTNQIWLTPFLQLNPIKLTAKAFDPSTSLDKMQGSQIVGSPQFRVRIIPDGMMNEEEPRMIISTGAITDANYDGGRYISQRTNAIAESVHQFGAYVLERTNGQTLQASAQLGQAAHGHFNGRHIEYIPEKQGFMDLDTFYTGATVKKANHEALVLGDVHVGHTRQALLQHLGEIVREYGPKRIVLHDLFDGHSISHHESLKQVSLAQKFERGETDLATEIGDVTTFVNEILKLHPDLQVVIVASNHNDWLPRWLQDGGPFKQPQNRLLGNYLMALMGQGVDPLEHVMVRGWGEPFQINGTTFDVTGQAFPKIYDPGRVRFLRGGESLQVGLTLPGKDGRAVDLAHHGHAGANGARGSVRSFNNASVRIVFGHTHTTARINGTVNVGTFTELRQSYNKEGLSNWINSMALVGENGEIQVLTFVDDQWMANPQAGALSHEDFFWPNYPQLVPNHVGASPSTGLDQYSSFGKKK